MRSMSSTGCYKTQKTSITKHTWTQIKCQKWTKQQKSSVNYSYYINLANIQWNHEGIIGPQKWLLLAHWIHNVLIFVLWNGIKSNNIQL